MTTFIIGGTGFIGRRLVPLLAQRGEEIVCMDINPQTADYSALGKQVRVVRGDVSQFDDVMARITEAKPDRVVNLAYYIGSDLPPRVAFKLNVLGMDNVFEASRLAGCNRVVYASSVAVSGEQKNYGEHMVNEDDLRPGMCNTRCTRSSTNGRRRTTARSTGWRSPRSARPTSPVRTRYSARSITCSSSPSRRAASRSTCPCEEPMRGPVHVDEIAEILPA